MSRSRRAVTLAGALVVVAAGFALPEHVALQAPLLQGSVELFVVAVLALLLPRRRAVAVLVALGAVGWVFFGAYHRVVERIYLRTPAALEDWRLLLNLSHFLAASTSWAVWAAAAGGALAFACLGAAVYEVMRRLGDEPQPRRLLALSLLGLAVAGNAAVAAFPAVGWLGPKARAVAFGGEVVAQNVRTSALQAERARAWATGPADTRYEALSRRTLTRRPNVYLLMVEAYGEVLFAPPFDEFSKALLGRVEERLRAQGYGTRTGFSTAPVHGGQSWLSLATLQVGLRIDAPSSYAALERVGARVPGLTRFFERHGYRTYGLFPGNSDRRGLNRFDLFARQVVVEGPDLGFRGHVQPWGAAPDQYAWGFFLDKHLAAAPAPRFVTSMSVSTHWDWWYQAPYVADWRTLGDADEGNDVLATGWEPLALPADAGEYGPRYARSVEYEWRVLLDVIAADPSEDALFIVVGDHQPYLGPAAPRTSLRTPVHVITRHQPTLEAFGQAGFGEGLFAAPQPGTPLRHEGLFSLVVTRLALAEGQADAAAEYRPQGIALSGLRAVAP